VEDLAVQDVVNHVHVTPVLEVGELRHLIGEGHAAGGDLFGLPLRDTQTGLKVYEFKVLEKVFPKVLCKRYAYDLELLVNANHLGYKVVEAPVVLNFRRPKKWGRIGFNDLYLTGIDTLAIFYRMHILRYYDSIKT